jgi:hypothetical protein
LLLKLRQMMDNVLIHRSCPRREVKEGRRSEIIAGDHGFSASFELVLWTDPERYSDLLRTQKLVLLLDWSISRIISDRTLDPKRLLQHLLWRKHRRKFEPFFFFNGPKFQYCQWDHRASMFFCTSQNLLVQVIERHPRFPMPSIALVDSNNVEYLFKHLVSLCSGKNKAFFPLGRVPTVQGLNVFFRLNLR